MPVTDTLIAMGMLQFFSIGTKPQRNSKFIFNLLKKGSDGEEGGAERRGLRSKVDV
jgi:hypothetical protein